MSATPGARLAAFRRLQRQFDARMVELRIDIGNRLIWPGLAAVASNASPQKAALDAIAAARADERE